jgi:hypothetical protein
MLWGSKVVKIRILGILKLPTWKSRKKWHLDATPLANHRENYKGEGDDFPQVRAMVNFVDLCVPMARSCIENVPTMH